ncbi:MAG: hypothetical protein GX367_04350 [Bacteroidales bacterium]|nr:hypothetical protein [Bacteroidales bacterium]
MFKIGDRVDHIEYGEGEIVSYNTEKDSATVSFNKEHLILAGKITDTDNYFEDNRVLEKTSFIEVHTATLDRVTNCYSCKKHLTSVSGPTCEKCKWIVCDCKACGCNYKKPKNVLNQV